MALCAALAACQHSSVVSNPSSFAYLHPAIRDSTEAPYRIGVGDEIEIRFFATPELNDRLQVRPDGKVSVMFAQDVQAAGRTPQELANDIRERIASHVKQPDLVVVVRTFGSQKVFVGGEVTKPGSVQLQGRETLVQVIDEAGWMTPNARTDEVVLVRRDPDGHEGVYTLNMAGVLKGEDMEQNVLVEAGDMVLVPPSDAASLDRWVDKYIRQALPFSTAVYYDYSSTVAGH